MNDLYIPDEYLTEYHYSEIEHVEGRTLRGVGLRYGDVATRTQSGMPETYLNGAFGDVSSLDTILNFQHDRKRPLARTGGGGLTLQDTPTELKIEATLPDTQDANDALELVKTRVMRGFSLEILPERGYEDNGVRRYSKGRLTGIGLVDTPAFHDSLITELYQDGEGIRGEFSYDTDTVISATGKVRKERIKPGAFTFAIDAPDREINLILGDNSRPLASKIAGSLILEDTPTALKFRVKNLPRTSYVSDFLGALRAKSIAPGIVPFFAPTPLIVARRLFSNGKAVDEEEESKGSGIFRRVVKSGLLTALSILFRPPRGNPGTITTLPRRLRRASTLQPTPINAIRPISGDTVRDGRVIRRGVDIGPVAPRRRRFV